MADGDVSQSCRIAYIYSTLMGDERRVYKMYEDAVTACQWIDEKEEKEESEKEKNKKKTPKEGKGNTIFAWQLWNQAMPTGCKCLRSKYTHGRV